MVIVLFGCDKAGKTTIAKCLSEQIGAKYHKAVRIDDDGQLSRALEDFLDLALHVQARQICGIVEHHVWDRLWYPDDLVYEPVMMGRPSRFSGQKGLIEQLFVAREIRMVYVYTTYGDLIVRYKASGGDPLIRLEQLRDVLVRYHRFLTYTTLPVVELNTHNRSVDECVEELRRDLEI